MNPLPLCILYTQDTVLVRRIDGYLKFQAIVRHIDDPQRLEMSLRQHDPVLIFFDLRAYDTRTLLPMILKDFANSLVIALADMESTPAREARSMGVYAVESFDSERMNLQATVSQAQNHLRLMQENSILKETDTSTPVNQRMPETETLLKKDGTETIGQFFRACRHFENIDTMLDGMVEGIAACAKVSRVGIFATTYNSKHFKMMAGTKCLDDTDQIEIPDSDPFVHWMQVNAHLISRTGLSHITDSSEQILLKHWLDMLGAEVIIPLYGRGRILGWVFVGRRATGERLDRADLENLSLLGDYVSTMLENALLYEKVTVQSTLTDAVFDSVPVGIVVVASNGNVRWINRPAGTILEINPSQALDKPIEKLSSKLADQINRCMAGELQEDASEWTDTSTKRELSVITRRLKGENDTCMGAVALINDFTHDRILKEEQDSLERTVFWTELAAAISHEVRNPLVAISTFAQLLPTRYSDPEFREQFSQLVADEIGRLDGMVDQINTFANRPELEIGSIEMKSLFEDALAIVAKQCPENKIPIKASIPDNITIQGDKNSLADSFAHLLINSIESLEDKEEPQITVDITGANGSIPKESVLLRIRDNGRGLTSDNVNRVFSPFYTTKNRGIGLGLPIAKRSIEDHHGKIMIATNSGGGDITISLPTQYSTGKHNTRQEKE